jgi:hypothetical protein
MMKGENENGIFLRIWCKKIGSATDSAAEKSRGSEMSKLKSQIGTEEKQIEKIYYEIGKIPFETDKDDPDSPVRGSARGY